MKKFLIFFLLISLHGNAQVYQEFPVKDAVWKDYSWSRTVSIGQSLFKVNDLVFQTEGDTLVGKKYSKIRLIGWRHNIVQSSQGTTDDSTFECKYMGAIRTDSSKHVYFLPANSMIESLLYDFNLKIGDTLPLSYNYPTRQYNVNIVKGIDSVKIGQNFHKRFSVCTTQDTTVIFSIIEGLGSTRGLFNSLFVPPVPSYMYGYDLNSFYKNSSRLYEKLIVNGPTHPNAKIFSCNSTTGMTENINGEEFQVYPIPVKDYFNFHLEVDHNTVSVGLSDILGRNLKTWNVTGSDTQLDISSLPGGLYIIRVFNSKRVFFYKKIMKD